MILTLRALMSIFLFILIYFNQKAYSQTEIPLDIDSQNLDFIPNKSTFWLGQKPSQTSDLSEAPDQETLLLQALEVANSLEDPYRQAILLNDIAIKYANLGKIHRAQEILDRSVEVAREIEDIGNQVSTMAAIAIYYAEIDQLTTATELLSETIEIANSVPDISLQAGLLSEIALKYAELGEQSQTEILLSQSQEILEEASVPVADFPFQPSPLKGKITFGGEISSATNTERNLTTQLRLSQQWETDQFGFDINYKSDFDSSRSRDRYRTQILAWSRYRHHFDETWQIFTLARFERNIEDAIFYDVEPLVGPAINVFRQGSEQSLDMGLGLGMRYQDALGKPNDTHFPTVALIVDYKSLFFDLLKFRHRFFVSVPVNDSVDTRIISSTELSVPLWKQWLFTTQVRYVYRGVPATRRPPSEFDFTTGVSYEF